MSKETKCNSHNQQEKTCRSHKNQPKPFLKPQKSTMSDVSLVKRSTKTELDPRRKRAKTSKPTKVNN